MKLHRVLIIALLGAASAISSSAWAQQTLDWVPTDPANWNEGDNWELMGAPAGFPPDATFLDSASIANGGTAIVDGAVNDILNLTVNRGTLDVANGGSLGLIFDFDAGGELTVGNSGNVLLSGNGSLSADVSGNNSGTISITGSGATLDIGGDFSTSGTIQANVTGATHTTIQVGGVANLGGTLAAEFQGVVPALGDSWDILNAGGGINGNFDSVDLSTAPLLPLGARYESSIDGNTAKLAVGSALVLRVNRATGALTVENLVGDAVEFTGYTVESGNGLLNAGGFAGIGGDWAKPTNNGAGGIGELNLTGSRTLNVSETVDLGAGYAAGPQLPSEEDLSFQYLTGAGDLVDGIIKYDGPANDLVLNIDTETGVAAISNLSPFITALDVTGFSILSDSGSLNDGFTGFSGDESQAGAGWEKANPTANHLSELNLESSNLFENGTVAMLGEVFSTDGLRDLVFEYSTVEGQFLTGTIQYDGIPEPVVVGLAADFNKDGTVDLNDFNVLKENFGAGGATMADGDANMDGTVDLNDFNILKDQFGQSAGAAAVPEPSTYALALVGLLGIFCLSTLRRRRAAIPVAFSNDLTI